MYSSISELNHVENLFKIEHTVPGNVSEFQLILLDHITYDQAYEFPQKYKRYYIMHKTCPTKVQHLILVLRHGMTTYSDEIIMTSSQS